MPEVREDTQSLPAKPSGFLSFYWRIAVRPYKKQAMIVFLLMLASAALDMVTVGLSVPLLDVLTDPARAARNEILLWLSGVLGQWKVSTEPKIVAFALLVVACSLFVLRSLLIVVSQYSTAAIALRLRRNVKMVLFNRFLRAPYEDVSRQARGKVIYHINNPAEVIYGAMVSLGYLVTGIFDCALMIVLMAYLSWWTTAMIGVLAIGGVQGWRRFADHRAAVHGRRLYDLRAEESKLDVEAIDGLKVVKAHTLEQKLVQQQTALLDDQMRPNLGLSLLRVAPNMVNEITASVIVFGLGAITFLFPSAGISFSMLVPFLLAVRRLSPAMVRINQATVELNRNRRSLEVIEEVLQHLPEEKSGDQTISTVERLELAEVAFAYATRPEHLVLNNVSLMMRRGTVTAIVGSTGAGKSTVANLLLGLYTPRSGVIRINGIDLQRLDLSAWRRKIGYVSQDIFVFNTTIRDNIAMWEDVPHADVEWAAKVAQLHEFISSLPDGYKTVVGDRGLRLSGGQCQRLAIARAILHRPEVLIFDEATSALDNLTERAVYAAINAVHRHAVVIVIAHRLSTVRDADQIIVLQSGRVVEIGNHERLMGQAGTYARLYGEDRDPRGKRLEEPGYAEQPQASG